MRRQLIPIDIIAVTRHNKNLKKFNWHKAAIEGNFFLRGFNYLFIMRKPEEVKEAPKQEKKLKGRAKKRFFERKKFLEEKSNPKKKFKPRKHTGKKKFS